ncbi:MAG: hypothetical protein NUV77_09145 [Thermoguttaceae bacterium]|jgi:hypothetical protein|nr:hypothetical protein [Thermoguttaceae bacterium]
MSKEEWLKKREEKRAKEAQEDTRQKAEADKKKAEAEAARKGKKAVSASEAARSPTENTAAKTTPGKTIGSDPKPVLPDEFDAWKDADYLLARASGDPRLVLAVEHRGRRGAGNEKEAEFLARLVQPRVAAGARDALAGKSETKAKAASKALVEAVAVALGRNGTPAARNTLVQLISGTLKTEDDAAGAAAALKALAENPSPENEEILLAALVEPLKFRPPGQGDLGAGDLQREALAVARTVSGSRFRTRLAQWFVDRGAGPELRRLVAPMLLEVHPENLESHALLYQSDLVAADVRALIERRFVEYSSDALVFFLGIDLSEQIGVDGRTPVPARPNTATRTPVPLKPTDAEWPYLVARRLWSRESCNVLDVRLTGINSLDEGAQVCLLAATVPIDAVRGRLQRTLERYWEDGPAPLRNAGLGRRVVFEPGFVPVLKAARRKTYEGSKAAAVSVPKLRRAGMRPQAKPVEKDPGEELEKEWLKAEEALIRGLCQRLRAAALAEAVRNKRQPQDRWPTLDHFPVELHADATVVASFACDWPGRPSDHKLGGVPLETMRVRYVRIEEKARLDRLVMHYRRQSLKNAQTRAIADGTWFDSLHVDSATGSRQSVDLFITRSQADSKRPLDESQELTAEILVVELPRSGH